MLNKLTRKEKVQIIQKGWDEGMENHLCGDYFSWGGHDYHWGIDIRPRSYWFYVDGVGCMKYDFDVSFDGNLERLLEFMEEKAGY